ncbi:hypothetical protein JJB59_16275 [Clostridium perfringens]|uniref:hypothetical protein n=1 Tax=Clostridium perfringens TaxID=1502 RepID=UPI001ABB816A|nr:hypothetical protein [Clostridium perfringens]MBO3424669.1 hypothetical protein [Clostridium perfringens]
MKNDKGIRNKILQGDYKRIVIETDDKNPITLATITNNNVTVKDGYRARLLPN